MKKQLFATKKKLLLNLEIVYNLSNRDKSSRTVPTKAVERYIRQLFRDIRTNKCETIGNWKRSRFYCFAPLNVNSWFYRIDKTLLWFHCHRTSYRFSMRSNSIPANQLNRFHLARNKDQSQVNTFVSTQKCKYMQ